MCIRDSAGGTRVVIEEFLQGEEASFIVLCDGKNALALATSCLLYTSDAADERSSVDLGGRRIIKQKKGIYHRRDTDHQPQELKRCRTENTTRRDPNRKIRN